MFWTASTLVRLTGVRAGTIGALRETVASCDPPCLFHHTYQALREHHFVTEPYPNDFAQWVRTSARDESLAERLAAVDLRDITSLEELRARLLECFDERIAEEPRLAGREGIAPFHLCRAQIAIMPTGRTAGDPASLSAEVQRASVRSVFYHFVEARLRLHLATNDFSEQLRDWGQPGAANAANELDIHALTLPELRERIAAIIREARP